MASKGGVALSISSAFSCCERAAECNGRSHPLVDGIHVAAGVQKKTDEVAAALRDDDVQRRSAFFVNDGVRTEAGVEQLAHFGDIFSLNGVKKRSISGTRRLLRANGHANGRRFAGANNSIT